MTLVAGQANGTVDYYPQRGGAAYDPVLNGGSVTSVTIYDLDGVTELASSTDVTKVVDGHYRFTVADPIESPGHYPTTFVWNASSTGPVVTDSNDTVEVEAFGGSVSDNPPFATADDLARRLKRTFDTAETTAADLLLADASDHLRGLLGEQQITAGSTTVTLPLPVGQRRLPLPQIPVRSVSSVKVNGTPTSNYQLVDHGLELQPYGSLDSSNHYQLAGAPFGYASVQVTFSYGFSKVPGILRTWAITLAAQAFAQVEALKSIGSAGLQSERIDDYALSFVTSGDAAEAYHVPDKVLARLRALFSGPDASAAVVGVR